MVWGGHTSTHNQLVHVGNHSPFRCLLFCHRLLAFGEDQHPPGADCSKMPVPHYVDVWFFSCCLEKIGTIQSLLLVVGTGPPNRRYRRHVHKGVISMPQHLDRLPYKTRESDLPLGTSLSVTGGGLSGMGDPDGNKP